MGRKRKKHMEDREENRYGLFMSENSFNLDIMYGRHYQEQDVQFTIKLYRVDVVKTKAHKLYGQAKSKDKRFFVPVELNAIVDVEDNRQEYLGGEQSLTREDISQIVIGIYLQELEEKKTEVNRGDIIEYNVSGDKARYFEVENAQNVSDVTSQTIAGMRPYWKKVTAVPIKSDIVAFLNGDFIDNGNL